MNKKKTIIIVSNGYADGPSQALREYFCASQLEVTTIIHPLVPEANHGHIIEKFEHNKSASTRRVKLPHFPPLTYLVDLFIPLIPQKCSLWVGFNNLAVLKGIFLRRIGRVEKVVYWAVDFVPDRFGKSLATRAYNLVDKFVCRNADYRVELSKVGVTGRNRYLKLDKNNIAPTQVVPMGAWLDRTPKTTTKAWNKKTIVYLGHLVERQGVATLIKAIKELKDRAIKINAEIIGTGPLYNQLIELSKDLGVSNQIKFHGFVKEHKIVESILASGFLAAAPYTKKDTNFVQFSDAGKLKAYLGAGLPIILTDVPNNAKELEVQGAAFIVDDTPKSMADSIEQLLLDRDKWLKAHESANTVAKQFDWDELLSNFLKNIDFNL